MKTVQQQWLTWGRIPSSRYNKAYHNSIILLLIEDRSFYLEPPNALLPKKLVEGGKFAPEILWELFIESIFQSDNWRDWVVLDQISIAREATKSYSLITVTQPCTVTGDTCRFWAFHSFKRLVSYSKYKPEFSWSRILRHQWKKLPRATYVHSF